MNSKLPFSSAKSAEALYASEAINSNNLSIAPNDSSEPYLRFCQIR